MVTAKTHLMFQGNAEEAVTLYSAVFPEFQVHGIEEYGKGEGGEPGAFKLARASLAGHKLQIFDSPPVHKSASHLQSRCMSISVLKMRLRLLPISLPTGVLL